MRLFIAVNLPDWIREDIWDSAETMRERHFAIKWVKPESMHITLKFLGEVSAHRESAVCDAMEEAVSGVSPFILHLRGFGTFPNPRQAKVVWVGCTPPVQFRELYEQVEERLSAVGFARESRSFHPHVTVGRVRRGAPQSKIAGLPGVLDRLDLETEFPVRTVELMQSELSPAGAKYTVRTSIGLTG